MTKCSLLYYFFITVKTYGQVFQIILSLYIRNIFYHINEVTLILTMFSVLKTLFIILLRVTTQQSSLINKLKYVKMLQMKGTLIDLMAQMVVNNLL